VDTKSPSFKIKPDDSNKQPELVDQFALGRALINSSEEGEGEADPENGRPTKPRPVRENDAGITYKERLGGYLHPRDMRKLVSPFSASNEPELIIRRHAMLLNFDPLRAIILRDRLLVIVPDGADSMLVALERRVRGEHELESDDLREASSGGDFDESCPSQGLESSDNEEVSDYFKSLVDNEWEELEGREWIDLPFELQCVDAILHSVSTILADDVEYLQQGANAIITDLISPSTKVGDHAQEVLRTMKNSIKEMISRVQGFVRALEMTLEDYEDMALMNLSRLLTHPEKYIQPVPQSVLDEESDEPELILEAHLQRGNTLTNALSLVQGQITTTEDYAMRKSDAIRNRLLYMNMMISILSLCVGIGSFIGAMFGMNVPVPREDDNRAFGIIVLTTVGGSVVLVILLLLLVRKLGLTPS
jgi:magnesium transporter